MQLRFKDKRELRQPGGLVILTWPWGSLGDQSDKTQVAQAKVVTTIICTCVLRHPAIVSRRWSLAGVASFLDRAPESFSSINRHVDRSDRFGIGRRALSGLFVAFGRGPMGPGHERRTLALAKNAYGQRRLLFIATVKFWFPCKSSYFFFLFYTTSNYWIILTIIILIRQRKLM